MKGNTRKIYKENVSFLSSNKMKNYLSEREAKRERDSKLVEDVKRISLESKIPFGFDQIKGAFFRCYGSERVSSITSYLEQNGYRYSVENGMRCKLVYPKREGEE